MYTSIEGGELFDRVISVGKFTEPTAKFLFYQILTAVKVKKPFNCISMFYFYSIYMIEVLHIVI